MNRITSTLFIAACALAGGPAGANDGVFEISPLCVATGCFAGDDPGFPVQVRRPGRYVFTGNLDVSGEPTPEDVTAVQVVPLDVNMDVTIDLNGFEIRGPVTCTGSPVTSCSGFVSVGTGDGILAFGAVRVAIQNGSITGMGDDGIDCNDSNSTCRVENMLIQQNHEHGFISSGSIGTDVVDSVIRNNRANGVQINAGSVVDTNVHGNGGSGLSAGAAVSTRVRATNNGLNGISSSGVVEDSVADGNLDNGIRCFGCMATNSRATNNGGFGIDLGNSALFGGNRFVFNASGDSSGTGFSTVTAPNYCGDSSC